MKPVSRSWLHSAASPGQKLWSWRMGFGYFLLRNTRGSLCCVLRGWGLAALQPSRLSPWKRSVLNHKTHQMLLSKKWILDIWSYSSRIFVLKDRSLRSAEAHRREDSCSYLGISLGSTIAFVCPQQLRTPHQDVIWSALAYFPWDLC